MRTERWEKRNWLESALIPRAKVYELDEELRSILKMDES